MKHVCVRCEATCCRPGLLGEGRRIQPHEHETREAARAKGVLHPDGDKLRLNREFCAALQDHQCMIHDAKPSPCRQFPFFPLKPEKPIIAVDGTCLAVTEFVREHPESVVAIARRPLIHTTYVLRDDMLRASLFHTCRENNIPVPPPYIVLDSIRTGWYDDPVLKNVVERLEKGGVKLRRDKP